MIDRYYLRDINRGKRSLVHLNGAEILQLQRKFDSA